MALSDKARKRFEVAMARRQEAEEILDKIESQAASVAAVGALASVASVDVANAGPVQVATQAGVNARLLTLQAKIDEVIAALKAAGLMA
jgi:2-keto-3-deoxy-L-rhamnonate aldolase RhmA